MKVTAKILKKPLLIKLIAIFICIMGILSFKVISIAKRPDIIIPKVIIMVPYIGAEPREIEDEIIRKLEERIKKISNIKNVRSYALPGKAVIRIEFDIDADMNQAKTDVKSAFDEARSELPTEIGTPFITDIDLSERPVLSVAVYGNINDLRKLRDIGDKLQTEIETINGVSTVTLYGGLEREIRIDLNPLKLKKYNISITEVTNFIKNTNVSLAGGSLKIKRYEYPIKISGKIKDILVLKESIIKYTKDALNTGVTLPIRLKDVADVYDGAADIETISRYNGMSSINLRVSKRKGYNTLKLSKSIRKKLASFKKQYLIPHNLNYAVVGDDSDDIIRSTNDLFSSIWQGIIAIIIVLSIGMGVRNGVITSMAIPFCFLTTMAFLYIFGFTLNQLIQIGLIIVVGMVVDGALVVMENIYRHREMGKETNQAIIDGVEEIGSSVITSDLTTIVAFMPLLFMTGVTGRFFSFIPIGVIIGLTASLFFDHFIIPVFAKKYMSDPLNKAKLVKIHISSKKKKNVFIIIIKNVFKRIKKFYHRLIELSVNRKGVVLSISALFLFLSFFILKTIPKQYFPKSRENRIYMSVTLSPISSIERTNKLVKRIEKKLLDKLRKKSVIRQYASKIGAPSNVLSRDMMSTFNSASITIDLFELKYRKNYNNDRVMKIMRKFVKDIPNAIFNIEVKRRRPSTRSPINVVITGEELRTLKMLSRKVQALIKKNVREAVDIVDNYGTSIPQFKIFIKRKKANLHGVSVRDIANTLSIFFKGIEVSNLYSGENLIKIRLKIKEKFTRDLNSLNKVYIYKNSNNQMIPLKDVVSIKLSSASTIIVRENMHRAITISGNAFGNSSTEVMKKIKSMLKEFPLPQGYSFSYRGENEDREEAFQSLMIAFAAAILLVYFIIALQLNSPLHPISILTTILLSIIGVSFALLISGTKFGVMAMFGMVSLAGIVVNDAIVLISYVNQLRNSGYERDEAIKEACKTRVRPILLTTFTTMAGLMPLALGIGGSNSKYWGPMAWTIIVGLFFATFQTLIVVPTIYVVIENIAAFVKKTIRAFFSYIFKLYKYVLRKVFKYELHYQTVDKLKSDALDKYGKKCEKDNFKEELMIK